MGLVLLVWLMLQLVLRLLLCLGVICPICLLCLTGFLNWVYLQKWNLADRVSLLRCRPFVASSGFLSAAWTGGDLRHVCVCLLEKMCMSVSSVKMLTDNAVLLCFAEDHLSMSLHAILSMSCQEGITSGELTLIRWTHQYGSVGDVVTQFAELKIIGLPCNLFTVPVIEYILSPFALVETHVTMTDDSPSGVGTTVTAYKCSVWCTTVDAIPTALRVKVLTLQLTDTLQISSDIKCRCPMLTISIRGAGAVLDGMLPI